MRKRMTFIPVGVIVALALMPAGALAAGGGRAASRAHPASTPRTWTAGCGGEPDWSQHPSSIGLTCDSVAIIVGLRWRDWGDATAQAAGTLDAAMSCTPNCAEAPRRHYAVRVVASDIGYCGARRVYGEITVYYTGRQSGRKPVSQPALCSTSGQRPTTHPAPKTAPSNPTEFYARPPGGFITCGIGGGVSEEQLVRCQGALIGTNPLENVATLRPDGQVETCSRRQQEVRCFEGNVGENTPTLSAGEADTIGPFTCKILEAGVECTVTATGKGFLITPQGVTEVGG
jgi:hypothetical protein